MVPLLRFTVSPEEEGIRVDAFLAQVEPIPSRAFAQKLLKNGKVKVASLPVKPSYRLQAGDVIEVDWEEPQPLAVEAEDLPLTVLYEDGDLIVVNKPRGWLSIRRRQPQWYFGQCSAQTLSRSVRDRGCCGRELCTV